MAGALEAWITWATWVALEAGWQVIECQKFMSMVIFGHPGKNEHSILFGCAFKIVVLLTNIEKFSQMTLK